MPLYEFYHTCPLTLNQRQSLATAITHIHTTKFTTPALFVQVKFHVSPPPNPSSESTPTYFIAGKAVATNQILIHLRTGPSRTKADYDDLCFQVERAWNDIAGIPLPAIRRSDPSPDTTLGGGVMVVGGILAGRERGFALPAAGEDVQWFKDNWAEFESKAQGGDVEIREMMEEVRERGLMGSGKTKQQELEEMLGWGDAA